jgi:hypothetical protein
MSMIMESPGRQANNLEDRRLIYHPCFATRLAGVSGGKDTQAWRDSSHTAMVGAGKFGSAKLPMAIGDELGRAILDCDIAAFDVAGVLKTLPNSPDLSIIELGA